MYTDWDEYLNTTEDVITGDGYEDIHAVIKRHGLDVLRQFVFQWLQTKSLDFAEFKKEYRSLSCLNDLLMNINDIALNRKLE
jgi:hypothetical protein